MLLKGFLLIGFVLNAFCLNNLSGEFLSPTYGLSKNESLIQFLDKDPSSFVELFANADHDTIVQVIALLETLAREASSSLGVLQSHLDDATNELDARTADVLAANTNVQNKQSALEQADSDHSNAVTDQTNAVSAQDNAQSLKLVAEQTYDQQSPGLIKEEEVLRQVINTLGGLNGESKVCFRSNAGLLSDCVQISEITQNHCNDACDASGATYATFYGFDSRCYCKCTIDTSVNAWPKDADRSVACIETDWCTCVGETPGIPLCAKIDWTSHCGLLEGSEWLTAEDASACGRECNDTPNCQSWTFWTQEAHDRNALTCSLRTCTNLGAEANTHLISGLRDCPGT